MPRRGLLLLLPIVPLALVLGLPVQAAPPAAAIRLRAATFVPSEGEPAMAQGLRARRLPEGARGAFLVQFGGPVLAEWKDAVASTGAEILEYVPDFAFKVHMTRAQARRVRRLAAVRWVGAFHPGYKLSPTALARRGDGLFVVRLESGASASGARTAMRAAGAEVAGGAGRTVLVRAAASRLAALARLDEVGWIEPFVLRRKHNEFGGGVILRSAEANALGYDGSSQTVAVADTGLGGGTAATAHRDIPSSRITALFNWPGATNLCFTSIVNDGPRDVDTGHGTHTTSSILSGGDSAGRGRGTAPEAHLVFQAVENYATLSWLCKIVNPGLTDGYYLTGLPTDLRQLFLQAYDAGARVHSNSWGAEVAGAYTADSANADDFVWTHRNMTITFSAGNAGVDADGNGGVDGDSMSAPATAKNVIAVGASENDRMGHYECDTGHSAVCGAKSGQNDIFTWSEAWPFDYPAPPLKDDPSAGNAEQMAAFSSRGPADDGRIKPDVVAPGTWVLSGFSDLYQEGYDALPNPQTGGYQYDGWGYPLDDKYKYMGGTSMANPLVAGGAAVVRDYYEKEDAHDASAALVKATLVNSAVDLLDENNDGVNDNAVPIPNFSEGWGRVDLAAATDGTRLYVDEEEPLATGQLATFTYDVQAGAPLKVTLAWSDYRGTAYASRALVNDLDLEVSGPGGASYRGNVFGAGWSASGGLADRVNNLENVYVQSPPAGAWTVTVRAFNVPQGPQPFALVVAGQVVGAPVGTPTSLHVADLDGGTSPSGLFWWWQANATIGVVDDLGQPVPGATVAGSWSAGRNGSTSCMTGADGRCQVSREVSIFLGRVRWTVTSVAHPTLPYVPAANGDPDGDSNGTFIVVAR